MVEESSFADDAPVFPAMAGGGPFFGSQQLMMSRSRLDKIPMDVVTLILSNCSLLEVMKAVPQLSKKWY